MFTVKVHLREGDHSKSEEKRLEILRGTVHLFRDVSVKHLDTCFGSLPALPEGRREFICIVGVPTAMEPTDLLQYTSSFSESIKKVQCIRDDGNQVIFLDFDSQGSADAFYRFYSGNLLPLKVAICHVLFIETVQYTNSLEEASEPPAGLTEIPTCTVCLERLDEHISGVPITFLETLSPRDSSCLVCRYCTQSEKSTCSACPTSENLWVCVICGFLGCGRYKEGHAIKHWKETRHCYSLELESQRVWDYVGDNYVHRIVESKTDGNVVELTAPSNDSNEDCSSCECSRAPEVHDTGYTTKLQAMEYEYKNLLASETEKQRQYYEEQLAHIQQELEDRKEEIAAAIDKQAAVRVHKLQEKLFKLEDESKFFKQVNQCFADNQKVWEKKLQELQERGNAMLKQKDKRIQDLEQQIQVLMGCLEGSQKTRR